MSDFLLCKAYCASLSDRRDTGTHAVPVIRAHLWRWVIPLSWGPKISVSSLSVFRNPTCPIKKHQHRTSGGPSLPCATSLTSLSVWSLSARRFEHLWWLWYLHSETLLCDTVGWLKLIYQFWCNSHVFHCTSLLWVDGVKKIFMFNCRPNCTLSPAGNESAVG